MPVSKAQQKAVSKYMKANYDRIDLLLPKGKKEVVKEEARKRGETMAQFINRAIDEAIKRN